MTQNKTEYACYFIGIENKLNLTQPQKLTQEEKIV